MSALPSTVTIATPAGPIEILVRSSARARRFRLTVAKPEAKVALVIPVDGKYADALHYAQSQRGAAWIVYATRWIATHLNGEGDAQPKRGRRAASTQIPMTHDAVIPILGVPHIVRLSAAVTRVIHRDGEILVPGAPEHAAWRVRKYLDALALATLTKHVTYFAKQVDRSIAKITVRDTISRWGSCSANGNLSFCWRLILAPEPILAYVAAHEVAHRVEMNHSARFWRVVAQLGVDAKGSRAWLKANSKRLHSYN